MKKVLILGANYGQIPFLRICRELGCYVIVCSIKGDYPAFSLADKVYYADIADKYSILKIAKKEHVDLITTDQTDVAVPTVAYVSEKLGLKSIGYERSLVFSNKYLMRKKARELGICVPNFFESDSCKNALEQISLLNFPVIIKPVDSSGSRGVRKCNSIEELKDRFSEALDCSKSKKVIVEEFIEGREYLADGFALDGKFINTDVGIKEYFNKSGMYISKMCMFTSAAATLEKENADVLLANKKLVEGLSLPFGITHAEYIYGKDGKVYLVEIAARGGGVFLSSHITPKASGIDTNRILLEYLINGKNCDITAIPMKKKTSAWICFELYEGTVSSISGLEETKKIPGVYLVNLDGLCLGQDVKEMKDDTGKFGPILISGDSREECFSVIKKVKETLKIATTDKNGIIHQMNW